MRFVVLFLPLVLLARTSFISPMEYATSLYQNPRGIGCNKCHGENGEGKLVATYIHKKEKRSFIGPKINEMSFAEFSDAINSRIDGMPRYFLTDKEIKALYLYLQEKRAH